MPMPVDSSWFGIQTVSQ